MTDWKARPDYTQRTHGGYPPSFFLYTNTPNSQRQWTTNTNCTPGRQYWITNLRAMRSINSPLPYIQIIYSGCTSVATGSVGLEHHAVLLRRPGYDWVQHEAVVHVHQLVHAVLLETHESLEVLRLLSRAVQAVDHVFLLLLADEQDVEHLNLEEKEREASLPLHTSQIQKGQRYSVHCTIASRPCTDITK